MGSYSARLKARTYTRAMEFGIGYFPTHDAVGVPPDAASLEELERAGARRVVHWIPSVGLAGVERALERWESAIAELTGGV
jgi:hypothetical protein